MEAGKRSRSGESAQTGEVMSRASDVCTTSSSKRLGSARLIGVVGVRFDDELNGGAGPR
jgi:hypothetical protein